MYCIEFASTGRFFAMTEQLKAWKFAVDRFWSADAPDFLEAAQLAAEIAASGAELTLRQAASHSLPSLRNAIPDDADQSTKDAALRRLNVIRGVLHKLTTPTFGKRGGEPEPLTRQEHYRRMLGLPLDRPLVAPEIHRAFKRAAKAAHPDAGGSAPEFINLAAARDALMKER